LNVPQMKHQASDSSVALLFSGGLDSTLAATVLARSYDIVHLISVSRGYGHTKIERTATRLEELRSHVDGAAEFTHSILSGKELFRTIVLRTLARDIVRFRGLFVICVGCKLVMHTIGTIYCLEHGIPNIADGASGATEWMSDQAPVTLEGYRQLHETFAIRYSNPVVNINDREHAREALRRLGIRTGRKVAGRDLGTQPVCYYGDALTFLRESLFKVSLPVSDKAIGEYVALKMPMLIRHVHRHFELVGQNVTDRIRRLSELKDV